LNKLKTVTLVVTALGVVTLGTAMLAWGRTEGKADRADTPAARADPVPEDKPVPEAGKDKDLIQGNWRVTKNEMGRRPRTTRPGANEKWVIEKGRIEWSGVPRPVTLSYSIDPTKNPRHIDMEIVEGVGTGGRFKGIYKLDKDTLEVSYHLEGDER